MVIEYDKSISSSVAQKQILIRGFWVDHAVPRGMEEGSFVSNRVLEGGVGGGGGYKKNKILWNFT